MAKKKRKKSFEFLFLPRTSTDDRLRGLSLYITTFKGGATIGLRINSAIQYCKVELLKSKHKAVSVNLAAFLLSSYSNKLLFRCDVAYNGKQSIKFSLR